MFTLCMYTDNVYTYVFLFTVISPCVHVYIKACVYRLLILYGLLLATTILSVGRMVTIDGHICLGRGLLRRAQASCCLLFPTGGLVSGLIYPARLNNISG